jgi:hypothetical protein
MKKLSKSKAKKCGIKVFRVLDRKDGHNRDSGNSLYDRAVQIPCVCLFTAQESSQNGACMIRCVPEGSKVEVGRRVRKPLRSRFAHALGWTSSLIFLLMCAGILAQIPAHKEEYVRLSTLALLTFDELVELEKTDEPSAKLAARLDQLLHTPFLSNEAFYGGAKPNRPSSETLGPFIRATMWNIERGIGFDGIRISLTDPDQLKSTSKKGRAQNPSQLAPKRLRW